MGNRTVVVVDDEDLIRDAVSLSLEVEGFEVTCFENGAEALENIDKLEPCLILLDLTMPVMDGWAFLQKWVSLPVYQNVPIVVMSAVGSAPDVLEKGATGYLRKPVELNVLISTVGQHCSC